MLDRMTRRVTLMRVPLAAMFLFTLMTAPPTQAQTSRPAASPPAASPPAASPTVPSTPQQTTASFADWTLRCSQTGSGPRLCEVVQSLQQNERTVAQIAIGRPAAGQKLQLTVLVPTNVSFQSAPSLLAGSEGDQAPVATLTWRRCLPVGCLADTPLSPEVVTKLRGWSDPGRVTFTDGAGRAAALPLGPRGLVQALDALTKEAGAG